jgi:dienelactone hydrolase
MERCEYTDGETVFEGALSVGPGADRRPCVLVAHAWDGRNDRFDAVADSFARDGFVGFAIDVYGVRGSPSGDNSHLMNPLLANRALLRARLLAAYAAARAHPRVDPERIAILGYCFGGLCALDLARSTPTGLKGAISVHGPLDPPAIGTGAQIEASVLVLHGWEDPFAGPPSVQRFAEEMTNAGADWQIHAYGHAKHGFTFVGADIPQLGIKYDEKAHRRAVRAIREFLAEIFR